MGLIMYYLDMLVNFYHGKKPRIIYSGALHYAILRKNVVWTSFIDNGDHR